MKKNCSVQWNTDVSDDAFNSDTSFETFSKRCNWCNEYRRLVDGQKCCNKCFKAAYRVCKRCKRPFPSQEHFLLDSQRCTACSKKLSNERLKRQHKNDLASKTSSNNELKRQSLPRQEAPFDGVPIKQKRISKKKSVLTLPKKNGKDVKNTRPSLKINKEPLYMQLFQIGERLQGGGERFYFGYPIYSTESKTDELVTKHESKARKPSSESKKDKSQISKSQISTRDRLTPRVEQRISLDSGDESSSTSKSLSSTGEPVASNVCIDDNRSDCSTSNLEKEDGH